ncbi:MAG TPA: hypothetical protein VL131_05920 [Gammaproteobacteria bacterium]|nr:hypothetical protein [Gammaproteobacteria bacterium]
MIRDLVTLWREVPGKLDRLSEHVDALGVSIGRVYEAAIRAPKVEPSVVTLLLLANTLQGELAVRTSEGAAKKLTAFDDRAWLHVIPQRSLRDVTVLVLCDLERVQVDGIIAGVDAATLGGSPVGFFRKIEVGVQVGAHVRLRGGGS